MQTIKCWTCFGESTCKCLTSRSYLNKTGSGRLQQNCENSFKWFFSNFTSVIEVGYISFIEVNENISWMNLKKDFVFKHVLMFYRMFTEMMWNEKIFTIATTWILYRHKE